MSEDTGAVHHRLTPLAILLAFLLIIPGQLLGGIAAYLYRGLVAYYVEGNLLDWISSGWFSTLFMSIFPNALHGLVAGAFALWASAKVLRQANYEIVAYAVSAIVIAFAVLAVILDISVHGINLTLLELASNTGGLIVGLFFMWEQRKDELRSNLIRASPPTP